MVDYRNQKIKKCGGHICSDMDRPIGRIGSLTEDAVANDSQPTGGMVGGLEDSCKVDGGIRDRDPDRRQRPDSCLFGGHCSERDDLG